jgi:predicted peroxiredoxin
MKKPEEIREKLAEVMRDINKLDEFIQTAKSLGCQNHVDELSIVSKYYKGQKEILEFVLDIEFILPF